MYKKILVPLDGSKLAEEVFKQAKELVVQLDLELVLLHVYEPDQEDFTPMYQAYLDHSYAMIMREANAYRGIKVFHEHCTPVSGKCEAIAGCAAEEILNYAEGNDIDIILMATHGRSGIKRWLMGSVANKVLRASKVPVCLVRSGTPEEMVDSKWAARRLLVPLDGSEMAEAILPHVEKLAKQRSADLVDITLIRVCESPFVTINYPESIMALTRVEYVKHMQRKLKEGCQQYLEGVENRLKDVGVNAHSEVLTGQPAQEIISYVHKGHFDLIAMCTHARSELGQLVFGSVADKVLHGVSNPIFLVRPPNY